MVEGLVSILSPTVLMAVRGKRALHHSTTNAPIIQGGTGGVAGSFGGWFMPYETISPVRRNELQAIRRVVARVRTNAYHGVGGAEIGKVVGTCKTFFR